MAARVGMNQLAALEEASTARRVTADNLAFEIGDRLAEGTAHAVADRSRPDHAGRRRGDERRARTSNRRGPLT
jgi:hypothetical protein